MKQAVPNLGSSRAIAKVAFLGKKENDRTREGDQGDGGGRDG